LYEHHFLPAEVEPHVNFDLHDKLEDQPDNERRNYNQFNDLTE